MSVYNNIEYLLFDPQTGSGVFSTFPGNGGELIYPHTVKVILYAIGDRYRPAVNKFITQNRLAG